MATRSATRSSLTISAMVLPSTYSAWLRSVSVSGLKSGSPCSWVMRVATVGVAQLVGGVLEELGRRRGGVQARAVK